MYRNPYSSLLVRIFLASTSIPWLLLPANSMVPGKCNSQKNKSFTRSKRWTWKTIWKRKKKTGIHALTIKIICSPPKSRETIPWTTQKHNKTRQIVFEATKCGGNAHTALLLLLQDCFGYIWHAGSGGTGHQLRYPSPNIFTPAAFTTPTSHSFLHILYI